jgi:hypothetical protein
MGGDGHLHASVALPARKEYSASVKYEGGMSSEVKREMEEMCQEIYFAIRHFDKIFLRRIFSELFNYALSMETT